MTNLQVFRLFGSFSYHKSQFCSLFIVGISGRQLKSAGIAVYGPRTTITLAVDNMPNAHEFLLVDDFSALHGQWIKTNEFSKIEEGINSFTDNSKIIIISMSSQENYLLLGIYVLHRITQDMLSYSIIGLARNINLDILAEWCLT